MTKETMSRALLIAARFRRAQEEVGDTETVRSLYAQNEKGNYELSQDLSDGDDGEIIFHHSMTLHENGNGQMRKAYLENGNPVKVEGFGDELPDAEVGRYAQNLFHTLREMPFTPYKPNLGV